MKQYSNDGSPIELELLSGHLLFVDPLYWQSIVDAGEAVHHIVFDNTVQFIQAIEEQVFPYGGGMLLGYRHIVSVKKAYQFNLHHLQYNNHKDEAVNNLSFQKKVTAFSTDSGTFLILDINNFHSLLRLITYDALIDASLENRMDTYISHINQQLKNQGWAFIVSPGEGKGYVMEGSGSFIIQE